MPSPLGHGLAGLAVGWLGSRPARPGRALFTQALVLGAIATAPDLDLLWGRHSRETHSLGAALIVAAVAAWGRWPVGTRSRLATFAVVAAVWLSHPLLDVFAIDNAEPIGVMLWWPFSSAFVHSAYAFFDPISRHWHSPDIWSHNFRAALHELLRLGPLAITAYYLRQKLTN